MKIEDLSTCSSLHTAYIITGNKEKNATTLFKILGLRNVSTTANPDVHTQEYTNVTVEDARAIAQKTSVKPIGDAQYLILKADSIDIAAQHALLKTLEEAPGSTVFFILLEEARSILETVLSRAVVIEGTKKSSDTEEAAVFLSASYPERLEIVDKLLAKSKKQDSKAPIYDFIEDLIHYKFGSDIQKDVRGVKKLLSSYKMAHQNGASAKIILTELAVVL